MHQAFGNTLEAIKRDFDGRVLQGNFLKLAVVSDQRAGRKGFAQKFKLRHHFCFRKLLECFESTRFPAFAARRLGLAASEKRSNDLKVDAIQEFKRATRLGQATEEGKQRFCEPFGPTVMKDGKVAEDDLNGFQEQAGWSTRWNDDVAAWANHVEGLHERLNATIKPRRLLVPRTWLSVVPLRKKARRFHLKVSRPANGGRKKLPDQDAPGIRDRSGNAQVEGRFGLSFLHQPP
jgi:hypothetical protein